MRMGTSWRSLTHTRTLPPSSPSCELRIVITVAAVSLTCTSLCFLALSGFHTFQAPGLSAVPGCRELESQIIQFAAGLQSLGLGKGDKVRPQ